MACTSLFDLPVSDEMVMKIRNRLDVHVVSIGGDLRDWKPSGKTAAVLAWLQSDEARGTYLIGEHDWIFTDMPTAMAFKLRFG